MLRILTPFFAVSIFLAATKPAPISTPNPDDSRAAEVPAPSPSTSVLQEVPRSLKPEPDDDAPVHTTPAITAPNTKMDPKMKMDSGKKPAPAATKKPGKKKPAASPTPDSMEGMPGMEHGK